MLNFLDFKVHESLICRYLAAGRRSLNFVSKAKRLLESCVKLACIQLVALGNLFWEEIEFYVVHDQTSRIDGKR